EEWLAALGRLFGRLRAWLDRSDPDKVLDVAQFEEVRYEPGLGSYPMPVLRIGVGEASVQVVPMGRNAVGLVSPPGQPGVKAEGRVDITDGVRKYILYRTLPNGQEQWHVLGEDFQARPLDQERLEKILQDLLA